MEKEYEYTGIVMNDELKHGKAYGKITLSDYWLRFQYEGGVIELPLQSMSIRRGGSSNHLIFFEHPSRPGWTIYTPEKSIVKRIKKIMKETADPDSSRDIKKVKRSLTRSKITILIVLAIIAAIIYGLVLLRNPITRAIAKSIPVEWEQSLGKGVFEQYTASKTIIDDPVALENLEKITAPLLRSIPQTRYRFKIYIVQDSTINAFALPGGIVVLNTGLIKAVGSADELLGVIAHECAHVTQQHGLRKLIDSLGLYLIVKAFLGAKTDLWAGILQNGAFLLNQKFSRDFEQEADETGFQYLADARLNAGGLIVFLTRLELERKKADKMNLTETLSFLSTHPAPSSRIEYLQEKWNEVASRKIAYDLENEFKALQNAIK